jgi:hypothetical protein
MRRAFQAFLALAGIVIIGISLAHLAIGPRSDHRRHGRQSDF